MFGVCVHTSFIDKRPWRRLLRRWSFHVLVPSQYNTKCAPFSSDIGSRVLKCVVLCSCVLCSAWGGVFAKLWVYRKVWTWINRRHMRTHNIYTHLWHTHKHTDNRTQICRHAHTHTHTQTHTHTHAHTYKYIRTHKHIHTHTQTHVRARTHPPTIHISEYDYESIGHTRTHTHHLRTQKANTHSLTTNRKKEI